MAEDVEQQKLRRERRYPKVLADEVQQALRGTDHLGHEKTMELLKLYRKGKMRLVANIGLDGQLNKGDCYFKDIPPEHFDAIRQLDIAFEKLHKFNHGGAGDYAAADVERYMNSEIARRPRKRESATPNDEIAAYLRRRNYLTAELKKPIILDAMARFDVGERKVMYAAKEHGLTRSKKSTAR
ncbi:hypothetical protein [Marinobacter salicampi]|uniref:hypothetical protein n=1 Tax=Marinobacter salicampi TaxID=435907 RepID=UPI00140B6946|nr:hypothetical protein [Marinobacter salicampi]